MSKLLLVLALLLAASSFAAQPSSFHVTVAGAGRSMILIPGLSSPCSVWDGTISHYAARDEVHCLTLAGFAGVVPVEGEFLPRVRRELIAAVTPQQLEEQGDGMCRMLAAQSREQFAASTRASLASMITSRDDLDRVAAWAVQSDPQTVAHAVKEMLTTDLRDDLRDMTAPLLLIAASGGMPEQFAAGVKGRYEAQVVAAEDARVVVAKKARHFVMLDDPAFFSQAVDAFLLEREAVASRKRVEKER